MWRRRVIGAFLRLPAVVSHSSEKCPSFEGFGLLKSHDLLEPRVNPVGGLCLAQGGPRVDLGGDSVLTSVDAPTSTPYLRTFSFS